MKEKPSILKEKIRRLERQLKERSATAEKYQSALISSHQRIKKFSEELNSGLCLIRELHKSLLPDQPVIPGFSVNAKFQPARQGRSGDFFNVIQLDKMNFGILLAHAESYTASALFLSAFLQIQSSADRRKTTEGQDGAYKGQTQLACPAPTTISQDGSYKKGQTAKNFISLIHKKTSPALNNNEAFHVFFGIVSLRSFEMNYCLAGDIFVGQKSQGKSFQTLAKSAPRLKGQGGPLSLKEGRVVIQPKDTFLFCSPGVIRRTNAEGQSFGVKNLVRAAQQSALGALEIRQNVLFACNEFGKGKAPQQDMTVIAAQAGQRILRLSQRPSSKAV